MLFFKRIVICNLFAYYGKQELLLEKEKDKNLYLIYGRNGFGKTSFLRSLKLLFLGSGLLGHEVPLGSKFFNTSKPENLVCGYGDWSGILNLRAKRENEQNPINKHEFFVSLECEKDHELITITRSWNIDFKKDIKESLSYKTHHKVYENKIAQQHIDQLLPSSLVPFFIFDGEEIEQMAEKMKSELKDKIQNILNITPLDKAIKEIESIRKEIQAKSIQNTEIRNLYREIERGIETKEEKRVTTQDRIKICEEYLKTKQEELKDKKESEKTLIADSNKELGSVQTQKELLEKRQEEYKNRFIKVCNSVLLLNQEKKLENIEERLKKVQIEQEKSYLSESFIKQFSLTLSEGIASYLQDKIALCFKDELDKNIENLIKQTYENLQNDTTYKDPISQLGVIDFNRLPYIENAKELKGCILELAKLPREIKEISSRLAELKDESLNAEYFKDIKEEIEQLESDAKELQEKLRQERDCLKNLDDELIKLKEEKDKLGNQTKQDERMHKQLELYKSLKFGVETYKESLIRKLLKDLRKQVLENYKQILPKDNVERVDINEKFALSFINSSGEEISISSQSAGQKQIATISIFWALAMISKKQLPLVIDTPLGRIDSINRQSIVENYFLKASHQIIVLPQDTEFGLNEYERSQSAIAQTFEIQNHGDRDRASFMKKDIKEILGLQGGF
ncbi:AAA family ATPase [Helicobacter cetorum]|uniref:AAA family ATPase n=1 Tax=Helicobacter cetorum TaxID=138563 RepID=UPI000CF014F8|nr:AAA family ATPase [Helicobacter cetorum]